VSPLASSSTRNNFLQVEEQYGVNMEDQDNYHMEENGNNNVVQDNGINQFIQDFFGDEKNDVNCHDEHVIKKATPPIYEGSKANILSSTLLLVNLKVLNGFSKPCMTKILRYNVIYFIT